MPLFRWSVSALIMGLPATGLAQTPVRADLLGAWASTQTTPRDKGASEVSKKFLVLRDDSTWTWVSKLNDKEDGRAAGRWVVSGDSLWFGDMAATDTVFESPRVHSYGYVGGRIVPKWPTLKVNLKDGKLSLTSYDRSEWNPKSPFGPSVYSRSTDSEP